MDRATALALLGLDEDAGPVAVQRAYRRLVSSVHPDVSDADDATTRTVELTEAYALLRHGPPATSPVPSPDGPTDAPERHRSERVEVVHLDDDTVAVHAPADTTLLLLLEAAHELGDIVYLDPGAGLLEVLVEFVEAPTCSLLLTLQGRANGTTEVWCTVEALTGEEAPPVDAVAHLVARTLSAVAAPSDG